MSMSRDECVAWIQQKLGFRRDQQALIATELQSAQNHYEGVGTLPWFIINEDSPITILEGVSEYTLSASFIREVNDEGILRPNASIKGDIYHVRKVSYDQAVGLYGKAATDSTGCPAVYAIRARTLKFFPNPDDDYDYRWSFYQHQTALNGGEVSATANAWLEQCPELIAARAGREVAKALRDNVAIQLFSEQKAEWELWLSRMIAQREEANHVIVMGAAV